MRSLASAINLLLLSLVGAGLGPFFVGVLNDYLEPTVGAEAVRYTLSIVAITAVWSSFHNFMSARHLACDRPTACTVRLRISPKLLVAWKASGRSAPGSCILTRIIHAG